MNVGIEMMISSHSPSLPDAAHVMKRFPFLHRNQASVISTTAGKHFFNSRNPFPPVQRNL